MRAVESYRDTYLALDANGEPVAVLKRHEGVTDKDMSVFRQAHVPNAVELKNLAEHLEEELETPAVKTRIAELSRKRTIKGMLGYDFFVEQHYSEYDAKAKILNELIDRFIQIKTKLDIKPRQPLPKPEPGERGRQRKAEAETARKAADKMDPKLAALLEKRKALDEQIKAHEQELALENSRWEAKIIQQAEDRRNGVERDAQPKTLAERYREFMRREEKQQKALERA